MNSKYFIENLFSSSGRDFKFDSQFISETRKLNNFEDFNEIFSYLNSLKLFDEQVLAEIFKKQNFKKFRVELLQSIFEFSRKNFEDLKKKMDKKLEILRIFHLAKGAESQTKYRLRNSLSSQVDWDRFDRLVLDFDRVVQLTSKELEILLVKNRIRTEEVS